MVRSFFVTFALVVACGFVYGRLDRLANLNAILRPWDRDPVIFILLFAVAFVAGYNLLLKPARR